MSYWIWLLFAALARLKLREDLYLRLPKARTTARNAGNVSDFFNIPTNRVVELGTRIEI